MDNQWDGKSHAPSWGISIFRTFLSLGGLQITYWLNRLVSLFYMLFMGKARRSVALYNRQRGGTGSLAESLPIFRSFGEILIDRMALLCNSKMITWEKRNEEIIHEAIAAGKGVILLSAHVGNWGVAAHILDGRVSVPLAIIAADRDRSALAAQIHDQSVTIISIDDDPLEVSMAIHSVLRSGGVVAALGDRVGTGQECVMVPFMGGVVPFPRGIFAIATTTGSPIIPVFSWHIGVGHYQFEAFPPLLSPPPIRKERSMAIERAAVQFANLLEGRVTQFPEQWFNFYDFWHQAIASTSTDSLTNGAKSSTIDPITASDAKNP